MMDTRPIYINGFKITFSRIYNKFQVKRGSVVYEEFEEKNKAIDWAKKNSLSQMVKLF